jgi:hypothetical protein
MDVRYIISDVTISPPQNVNHPTNTKTYQVCAGHRQWQIALLFGPCLVDPVEIDVKLELDATSGTTIVTDTLPVRQEGLMTVSPPKHTKIIPD